MPTPERIEEIHRRYRIFAEDMVVAHLAGSYQGGEVRLEEIRGEWADGSQVSWAEDSDVVGWRAITDTGGWLPTPDGNDMLFDTPLEAAWALAAYGCGPLANDEPADLEEDEDEQEIDVEQFKKDLDTALDEASETAAEILDRGPHPLPLEVRSKKRSELDATLYDDQFDAEDWARFEQNEHVQSLVSGLMECERRNLQWSGELADDTKISIGYRPEYRGSGGYWAKDRDGDYIGSVVKSNKPIYWSNAYNLLYRLWRKKVGYWSSGRHRSEGTFKGRELSLHRVRSLIDEMGSLRKERRRIKRRLLEAEREFEANIVLVDPQLVLPCGDDDPIEVIVDDRIVVLEPADPEHRPRFSIRELPPRLA